MCGVFFEGIGGWVGGKRSRCFNSGYHDLGLLQLIYHYLFMYICQIMLLFLFEVYVTKSIISKNLSGESRNVGL